MSAMNGLSAIRIGYLISKRVLERPLARPVTTYCFCSSSSRLARSLRIIDAVPEVPITITGTARCCNTDFILPQVQGWSRYSAAIKPPIEMPK